MCYIAFVSHRLHWRPIKIVLLEYVIINTYSMKQPDLYYFETIKMTSQAQ